MKKWRCVFVVLWAATLFTERADAQTSLEGTWTAHFLMPSGAVTSATYDVARIGDGFEAVMTASGRTMKLSGFQAEKSRLTFFMNPGFLIECRLQRQPGDSYKGSCLDSEGNIGPAVASPPGAASSPKDIDLDEAFEVWGLSREQYEHERYPHLKELRDGTSVPEAVATRLVDVGGYNLNVAELGSGDVTVVLEAGLGDDHQVWQAVQKAVAERARVVAYDRAGIGMSDPSPFARSPDGMAAELKKMLEAAGFKAPFVLVGHAGASFAVRRFYAMYPEDVAGLVLIDPAHVDEDDRWKTLDAASWEKYMSGKRVTSAMISDAAASEFEAFVKVLQSDGFETPARERRVPAVVLSGLRPIKSPRWIAETRDGLHAKEELHRSLAEKIGADLIVSAGSGSYIHVEQPRLVVEAIGNIIDVAEK